MFNENLTASNVLDLFETATKMKMANLPPDFILTAVQTAMEVEGIYDLMKLWKEETSAKKRREIAIKILDMIASHSSSE